MRVVWRYCVLYVQYLISRQRTSCKLFIKGVIFVRSQSYTTILYDYDNINMYRRGFRFHSCLKSSQRITVKQERRYGNWFAETIVDLRYLNWNSERKVKSLYSEISRFLPRWILHGIALLELSFWNFGFLI